jgi:hypothetical protein
MFTVVPEISDVAAPFSTAHPMIFGAPPFTKSDVVPFSLETASDLLCLFACFQIVVGIV